MAYPAQLAWLQSAFIAALAAAEKQAVWTLGITQRQYAQCAACEAAAETGWGAHLPPNSNNVLGIKAFKGWTGAVVGADGTEQNPDGSWTGPQADLWCVFSSMADCFAEQLSILLEPRYSAAISATTPQDYITQECGVWSTGQAKGKIVTSIWNAHQDILNA